MQKPGDPWQVKSLLHLASRARRESNAALRQARAALGDHYCEWRPLDVPRRFPDDSPGPDHVRDRASPESPSPDAWPSRGATHRSE